MSPASPLHRGAALFTGLHDDGAAAPASSMGLRPSGGRAAPVPAPQYAALSPVLCWHIRIQHVAAAIVALGVVALCATVISLGTRRPALPSVRVPPRTYMTWAHTYGEATNRRFGLLGALAVARLVGRTLVLPTDLDVEAYVSLDYAGLRKEGISVVSEREFRDVIVPSMQPKFSTTDVIISMVRARGSEPAPHFLTRTRVLMTGTRMSC